MPTLKSYLCSEGHEIATPDDLNKCLAYVHGSPCKGSLKRVGKGSRKANNGASRARSAHNGGTN